MSDISIDINCDIGETSIVQLPDQIKFLDYVSSCNIATGFHAGDPYTMHTIIRKAVEKGVTVGLHPSYPDKANFGRRSVIMTDEELYASLLYQAGSMEAMCTMVGSRLHHIKLHGALYHDAHQQEKIASVVIRFLRHWPQTLIIYGQNPSILHQMADHYGLPWVTEAFADRRYDDDGRLISRESEEGVIHDLNSVVQQVIGIARDQMVYSLSGSKIDINAGTICIHSDHPGSLNLAGRLKSTLLHYGISINPPTL